MRNFFIGSHNIYTDKFSMAVITIEKYINFRFQNDFVYEK